MDEKLTVGAMPFGPEMPFLSVHGPLQTFTIKPQAQVHCLDCHRFLGVFDQDAIPEVLLCERCQAREARITTLEAQIATLATLLEARDR